MQKNGFKMRFIRHNDFGFVKNLIISTFGKMNKNSDVKTFSVAEVKKSLKKGVEKFKILC